MILRPSRMRRGKSRSSSHRWRRLERSCKCLMARRKRVIAGNVAVAECCCRVSDRQCESDSNSAPSLLIWVDQSVRGAFNVAPCISTLPQVPLTYRTPTLAWRSKRGWMCVCKLAFNVVLPGLFPSSVHESDLHIEGCDTCLLAAAMPLAARRQAASTVRVHDRGACLHFKSLQELD